MVTSVVVSRLKLEKQAGVKVKNAKYSLYHFLEDMLLNI